MCIRDRVCAPHRRLREEVARGSFREDLYYRLNGLCVTLPSLRDRTDIRQMVSKLANAEAVYRAPVEFSESALQAMEKYDWPGNIRQLFNVIRVAIALLDEGETLITESHLPEELFETNPFSGSSKPAAASDPWAAAPLAVSYTHLRAHETVLDLVCRLLLEKKKKTTTKKQ